MASALQSKHSVQAAWQVIQKLLRWHFKIKWECARCWGNATKQHDHILKRHMKNTATWDQARQIIVVWMHDWILTWAANRGSHLNTRENSLWQELEVEDSKRSHRHTHKGFTVRSAQCLLLQISLLTLLFSSAIKQLRCSLIVCSKTDTNLNPNCSFLYSVFYYYAPKQPIYEHVSNS